MNNNHLPRIEREAKEYAERTWKGHRPSAETMAHIAQSLADYSRAKIQEHTRAAPVVKALERVKDYIPASDYEVLVHIEQILETYKSDV